MLSLAFSDSAPSSSVGVVVSPPDQVMLRHVLGVVGVSSALAPSTQRQRQTHSARAQSHKAAPLRCQSQVQGATCAPDRMAKIRGSHDPLLGFHESARAAHRIQETSYLTRSQVY